MALPLRPRVARARSRRALATFATLVLVTGLAACAGEEDTAPAAGATPSPAESETSSPSVTPTPTESEAPSPTPTQTPTTASSAPPSSAAAEPAPAGLRAALLSAGEVPGLNDQSTWTTGRTGQVGARSFGWCQQYDALTVGASEGVQRDFRSGEDRAAHQVLDVVDETNARRAEQVFRSWHQECAGSGTRVGPIRDVSAGSDTAWWYLSSRARGNGSWEAFGLARSGGRLTLLRMTHAGQDHSYAPGQDPLERALVTAAAKLG